MKNLAIHLIVGSVLVGSWPTPAPAHSWYPKDCCNEDDCAPVEAFSLLMPAGRGPPQLVVTSRHGTAVVPQDLPIRVSQDGRMHVCMRLNDFGTWDVMCIFMPAPA
jgi:hypothetical protein